MSKTLLNLTITLDGDETKIDMSTTLSALELTNVLGLITSLVDEGQDSRPILKDRVDRVIPPPSPELREITPNKNNDRWRWL